ncbi:unnamed protein product, partial [marine sediment metagenome]
MNELLDQIKKDFWKKYRYFLPLLLGVVLFTQVYSPDWSKYGYADKLYITKLLELESRRQMALSIPFLKKHGAGLEQKEEQTEGLFFSSENTTIPIALVQDMAEKCGATVTSIEPASLIKQG